MNYAAQYFKLAQAEETAGNKCAALLLYLSSFCDSFNSGARDYPHRRELKSICNNLHKNVTFWLRGRWEREFAPSAVSAPECKKL